MKISFDIIIISTSSSSLSLLSRAAAEDEEMIHTDHSQQVFSVEVKAAPSIHSPTILMST